LALPCGSQVYSTPLVGVWVKGPSSVLHPLVTAACLRFAFSSLLMDRAVSPDNAAFLLLLCPEGENGLLRPQRTYVVATVLGGSCSTSGMLTDSFHSSAHGFAWQLSGLLHSQQPGCAGYASQ
jgi:hypothetical protein